MGKLHLAIMPVNLTPGPKRQVIPGFGVSIPVTHNRCPEGLLLTTLSRVGRQPAAKLPLRDLMVLEVH